MSKAVDERSPLSNSFQSDLLAGGHPEGSSASLIPYWSTKTASGVMGDATKASREKGEKFLEAATEGRGRGGLPPCHRAKKRLRGFLQ